MRIGVYVPLLVSAVLAILAPRAARRPAPRPAAWSLAFAALVAATGWLGSLALLAFTAVAQIPEVAEEGHWSAAVLRTQDPVSLAVAALSALALAAGIVSLGVAAVRQVRHTVWVRRECVRLVGDMELAVLDDEVPRAFALPGAPGRIVVSKGMLRCLGDAEREALLAHERAHLRGRHHRFQTVWRLTAAANPLLRPLAGAGGFVLERWADEEAAVRVGSRTVVARAVGRAALAAADASRPAADLRGGRPSAHPVLRRAGQRRLGQREPGRQRGTRPVRGRGRRDERSRGGPRPAAAGRPRRSRWRLRTRTSQPVVE
jgi:Zn-dependent protease with chaperone function